MVSYCQHWQSNILKKGLFLWNFAPINQINKQIWIRRWYLKRERDACLSCFPLLKSCCLLAITARWEPKLLAWSIPISGSIARCRQIWELTPYTKCASAFDMDVLLLHLPKGMIESLVHTTENKDHRFFTIEKEDLIFLLNRLCQVDHKRMIQHIILLANRIVKKQDNLSTFRDLMAAIEELIQKLMRDDRE